MAAGTSRPVDAIVAAASAALGAPLTAAETLGGGSSRSLVLRATAGTGR